MHSGRSMLTATAEIRDSMGELCVHGTGTFLSYKK
jgi:acyl-coenzyme A thioesterase PaaI-like protein